MYDDGGFFEEFNEDDVEEVELSASEEDYESIEDFKVSTVYQEIDGVLNEVEENEQSAGNDPVYTSADLSNDLSENGNVRVIYFDKYTLQNNSQTVSGDSIVLLDSSQFEVLIDEISSLKTEQYYNQTVSQNDYSLQLQEIQDIEKSSLLVNIMIFALCFGYFVKETVFKGL